MDKFSEISKGQGNDTNINNTEISDTNPILYSEEKEKKDRLDKDKNKKNKADLYRNIIHNNIEYDHYKSYRRYSIDDIDNLVELMIDICVLESGTVPINGNKMPVAIVKSRFLKLGSGHIEYIMNSLENNPSEV